MTSFFSDTFCPCVLHAPTVKLSLLGRILGLVGSFAGLEFIVGQMSHSLSLQADSGHMLSDGLALAIALFATWMARTSSVSRKQGQWSQQVEVWAALMNGLGLLGMAGLIAWEAYEHWQAPPAEILSMPMLITAIIGLVINGISFRWLQRFQGEAPAENPGSPDLNVQGVLLHVLADVMGSVGVILAAIAIWIWGWTWADDVISIGLAVLISGSAVPLIGQSIKQLRGTKKELSPIKPDHLPPSQYQLPPPSNLNALGFYELGQTDLSIMVTGPSSSRTQSARAQDTHNQPKTNKASSDK